MFFTFVPPFTVSDAPLTFKFFVTMTVSPSFNSLPLLSRVRSDTASFLHDANEKSRHNVAALELRVSKRD
jgi:hypothetical protein